MELYDEKDDPPVPSEFAEQLEFEEEQENARIEEMADMKACKDIRLLNSFESFTQLAAYGKKRMLQYYIREIAKLSDDAREILNNFIILFSSQIDDTILEKAIQWMSKRRHETHISKVFEHLCADFNFKFPANIFSFLSFPLSDFFSFIAFFFFFFL